jgi:hypothetical protein
MAWILEQGGSSFRVLTEVAMPSVIQDLLKSRRFWAAVALVAVPVLNEKLNLGMSEDQFVATAVAIVGFIVGESIRSSSAKA